MEVEAPVTDLEDGYCQAPKHEGKRLAKTSGSDLAGGGRDFPSGQEMRQAQAMGELRGEYPQTLCQIFKTKTKTKPTSQPASQPSNQATKQTLKVLLQKPEETAEASNLGH